MFNSSSVLFRQKMCHRKQKTGKCSPMFKELSQLFPKWAAAKANPAAESALSQQDSSWSGSWTPALQNTIQQEVAWNGAGDAVPHGVRAHCSFIWKQSDGGQVAAPSLTQRKLKMLEHRDARGPVASRVTSEQTFCCSFCVNHRWNVSSDFFTPFTNFPVIRRTLTPSVDFDAHTLLLFSTLRLKPTHSSTADWITGRNINDLSMNQTEMHLSLTASNLFLFVFCILDEYSSGW